MELHINPTQKKPKHIMFYCGINDLNNNMPQLIAYNILSLAKSYFIISYLQFLLGEVIQIKKVKRLTLFWKTDIMK